MAQAYKDGRDWPEAIPVGKTEETGTKPPADAEPTPPPVLSGGAQPAPLPHGCPPPTATDGPKHLFRVVAGLKPAASDFRTAYEQGVFLDGDPCQRLSLSCFTDRTDAAKLMRKVPHFRGYHICEGVIPAGEGLHLATPSRNGESHCSWWPRYGIIREQFFKVVP